MITGFLAGLVVAGGGVAAQAGSPYCPAHRVVHVAVWQRVVLGHVVRGCTWSPADRHVFAGVNYNAAVLRTTSQWGQVAHAACAINGGTYTRSTYRPSGVVWARGRAVTRGPMSAPAVGFIRGRVAFGAGPARLAGSGNIMNGLAYLVRKGAPITSHAQTPWATYSQYVCGPHGTDGWPGCYRSAFVRFRNGRVGMVEIQLATMPGAARILARMGVVTAITFDSGGGAAMWTRQGNVVFGTGTIGNPHGQRLQPDAIVVQVR